MLQQFCQHIFYFNDFSSQCRNFGYFRISKKRLILKDPWPPPVASRPRKKDCNLCRALSLRHLLSIRMQLRTPQPPIRCPTGRGNLIRQWNHCCHICGTHDSWNVAPYVAPRLLLWVWLQLYTLPPPQAHSNISNFPIHESPNAAVCGALLIRWRHGLCNGNLLFQLGWPHNGIAAGGPGWLESTDSWRLQGNGKKWCPHDEGNYSQPTH